VKFKALARAGGTVLALLTGGCVIPIQSDSSDGGGLSEGGESTSSGSSSGSASSGATGSGTSSGAGSVNTSSADGGSGSWTDITSNLKNMSSLCGTVMVVAAKPDEDLLLAGIAGQGVWASRDGGDSWTMTGTGAGSAQVDNRVSDFVFDPAHTDQWWFSGTYATDGVFVYSTSDDGQTLTSLAKINNNNGDVVSVDFTDPARKTLLVGAHETPQTAYKSTDNGMTWENVGTSLPAGLECPSPHILDTNTYIIGCNKPMGAILRSINGGTTWNQVSQSGGSFDPLVASDGSIYWPDPDGSMNRSTDQGVTWTKTVASGMLTSIHPIELPDHRIATLASSRVVLSSDQGSTWNAVTPQLPAPGSGGDGWFGLTYSTQRKLFVAWTWSCGNGAIPVLANTIMSYPFDYSKQ
jgi:hypothetical protein